MNTLSAIDEKRIRHDEQRRIVAYLRRRTDDPEIIFQRVVLMDYVLNGDRFSEDAVTAVNFAKMFGVSEARISIALSRLMEDLENFNSVNFSSTPANPGYNFENENRRRKKPKRARKSRCRCRSRERDANAAAGRAGSVNVPQSGVENVPDARLANAAD